MTAIQLKAEIDKELDKVSEETLTEILDLIKKAQFKERMNDHFENVVSEHENLLRRLAQ